MAQFDIHRLADGGLVLDCQSDLVSKLVETRFVLPLLEPIAVPAPIRGLHPRISFEGTEYLVVAQLGAAVAVKKLSKPLGSIEAHRYTIINALDFLTTGV